MSKIQEVIKQLFAEGPIGIYFMAFLIPLNPKLLGIATVIIIVEQLIRSPKIDKGYLKTQLSWRNPGIWLLFFYLMHVVGLINTVNMGFANMDLGMKATMGIFPVFFLFYKTVVNWNFFVKSFITGAFISIALNLLFSIEYYTEIGHFYALTGEYLSHFMHRGYWAVYMVLAYFFLLKLAISSRTRKSFTWNLIGASVMLIFVIISGAKIGIIMAFFVSAWGLFKLSNRFASKKILLLFILGLVVVISAVVYVTPGMDKRMSSMVTVLNKPIESYDKEEVESTSARVMVWDSSKELIRENFWFGVGTGDVKDELTQRNIEKGYSGVAEKRLNCHNQFLNSHIALGVFGSLFLFLSLAMNFLKLRPDTLRSWRLGIITILFIALLPESMMETQAGIIPYAFLISFLPSFQPKESL
ncbi:O-antigen ligase family protein [Brumimicrobium oceani]|uniref:O-antigen ligase-related domain-containing protein n=1 Tax=Brumimicrobium oceani TaxID=2100725 RepID=A0A2U2XGF5_9FLAO|nr:O-antigen ligase family protein [Brumimicrobium oceani]PWH86820.1 hypothetical protein DIT68_00730 [Brumimicrobium oceani]